MFLTLLTILFIGLKLSNTIDWSWWLVISPMIFKVVLWILIVVSAIIIKIRKG